MFSRLLLDKRQFQSLVIVFLLGVLMVTGFVLVYSLDAKQHQLVQEVTQLQASNKQLEMQIHEEKQLNESLLKQLQEPGTSTVSTPQSQIASVSAQKLIPSPSPLVTPNPVGTQPETSSVAPSDGFTKQSVTTELGSFTVSYVAADLATTKVIVDTASGGDCANDCPVLPLSDYISRNGAYAGINGSYFCPASYPTCAGKTNSFDLLLMNKDKTYFNSANNVYSTNPAVIFQGGSARFVSQALEWGRDTGIDSMISNYPLLLQNGEVRFAGDSDPKKSSRGPRGFVASKGNIVYIGIVSGATVAEAAQVLKTMGLEHALNLDSGGSTALWSGGYKVGPGRNIPNAILFVKK